MNLLNDQGLSIEMDKQASVFTMRWTDAEINEQQFKDFGLKIAKLTKQYMPKGILMNARSMKLILGNELQAWFNQHVIREQVKAGVQFVAVVSNPDFLTQLAIEQTMDGEEGVKQFIKYFASEVEAFNWLTKSND